ncbi:hypothetical protein V8C42DRAFT_332029, partial [Trichoderma barbatum]
MLGVSLFFPFFVSSFVLGCDSDTRASLFFIFISPCSIFFFLFLREIDSAPDRCYCAILVSRGSVLLATGFLARKVISPPQKPLHTMAQCKQASAFPDPVSRL